MTSVKSTIYWSVFWSDPSIDWISYRYIDNIGSYVSDREKKKLTAKQKIYLIDKKDIEVMDAIRPRAETRNPAEKRKEINNNNKK